MRITSTLPALVMGMAVFCMSCSKTSQQEMVLGPATPATQVVNASVLPDGLYELPVSSENVKIYKQAVHFELSVVGEDPKNGMIKYKYAPSKGFTGTDEVTLSETKTYTSVGNGCNYDGDMQSGTHTSTTFTKIKFTVK